MDDHVNNLQQRVDRNRKEREREKKWREYLDARWKLINEAARFHKTDFWCRHCTLDFTAYGFKRVSTAVPPPDAWYEAFCPLGHFAVRHITDKPRDPYYRESVLIRQQRHELRDELLQPDDPRFKHVYPTQWRRMQEEMKQAELAANAIEDA